MALHNQKHLDDSKIEDTSTVPVKNEPADEKTDLDSHQFKAMNLSQTSTAAQDNKVSGESILSFFYFITCFFFILWYLFE